MHTVHCILHTECKTAPRHWLYPVSISNSSFNCILTCSIAYCRICCLIFWPLNFTKENYIMANNFHLIIVYAYHILCSTGSPLNYSHIENNTNNTNNISIYYEHTCNPLAICPLFFYFNLLFHIFFFSP